MTTPVTVAQFRANFTEFASTTTFPNSMVQFWLNVAYQMLNASRWGRQLDLGAQLYAAHNCILEARMNAEAANGGIPGASGSGIGVVNSKSVDKVSVGLDVSAMQQEFMGAYGLTVFGVRLWQLIRLFGAGPLQVATPGAVWGSGQFTSIGAWSGPDVTPGFTNFAS